MRIRDRFDDEKLVLSASDYISQMEKRDYNQAVKNLFRTRFFARD